MQTFLGLLILGLIVFAFAWGDLPEILQERRNRKYFDNIRKYGKASDE